VNLFTAFLALAPAGGGNSAAIFDSSLAAYKHLQKGSVSIEVETLLRGTHVKSSVRLQFVEPGSLLLSVSEPQQQGFAASRRTYSLQGERVIAVDEVEREFTSRTFPFPSNLGVGDRVSSSLGSPGEAAMVMISPRDTEIFYGNFRTLDGFRHSFNGPFLELQRTAGPSKMTIDFDRASMLLRKVDLETAGGSFQHWSVAYGSPPASVPGPNIAGMRQVDALTAQPTPPHFLSKEAETLSHRSRIAYRDLRSGEVVYTSPEGSGRFWLANGRYRQDSSTGSWDYRDHILTVQIGRTFYQGRTRLRQVPPALAKLGIAVPPLFLQILQARNPMGTLMATSAKVRVAGSISMNGAPCSVLEVLQPGLTMSLLVRKADGLILNSKSAVLDLRGHTMFTHQSTYDYSKVNESFAESVFSLPVSNPRGLPVVPDRGK
jgi:hypothetical protein